MDFRNLTLHPKNSVVKLHCQTYSSGYLEELHQPPIIFLHGMIVSGKVFSKVAPIISKNTKRKAYVPDIRNHGKSPWVDEMNYEVLTYDLLELMQQYGIPKAILIGNSMGGRIAMNFCLKYPEKVEALIVEDMTPRNIISSRTNLVKLIFFEFTQDYLNSVPSEIDLNEVKKNLADFVLEAVPQFVDKKKALLNYDSDFFPLVKEGNSIKLECNTNAIASMLENNTLVQNLPDLNIRYEGDALFIYGSKGFFNLGKDSSIKKLFPRSIIKKIEGASHCTHLDSPEEYTQIITDFLQNREFAKSKY